MCAVNALKTDSSQIHHQNQNLGNFDKYKNKDNNSESDEDSTSQIKITDPNEIKDRMKANLQSKGIDFSKITKTSTKKEERTYEFEEYDPLYIEDGVDKFAEAGL